jgi:hypothetical protein
VRPGGLLEQLFVGADAFASAVVGDAHGHEVRRVKALLSNECFDSRGWSERPVVTASARPG